MPGAQGATRKGAGDRRHRATLQSGSPVLDALRGRTTAWTTYTTVWAAVDPMAFVVDETKAAQLFLVSMPYHPTMEKGHRVLVAGMTLKVLEAVNVQLLNRDLVLHCAIDTRT